MPGLTAGLFTGLSGLQAHQSALNVVGHNMANVNTPGYARQRADLGTLDTQFFGGLGFGPGVTVNQIKGVRDRLLELQIFSDQARQSGTQTRYEGLEAVSAAMADEGDTGIGKQVQKLFQGFQDLSVRPEDLSLRQSVVGSAQNLILTMQSRYQGLEDQRNRADTAIAGHVEEINSLTSQIAVLNQRIVGEPIPGSDSDARDQRKLVVDRLSKLIGITVFEGSREEYQITLDSGAATLVSGLTAYTLKATRDPALNNAYRVDVLAGTATINVTNRIADGELGGELDLRDNLIPPYQSQLDELAAGLASEVNLLHRTGFNFNGANLNTDFFQGAVANGANGLPPTVTAATNYKGMVNALAVNAGIVGNPRLIAAAGVANAPGDNQIARAIADLQFKASTVDTNGDGTADTGPFSQFVGLLVSKVGSQTQGFQAAANNQQNLVTALQNQRDRVSAVDLDEEAALMMNYQRGYQASARFISVINQLTDQLMNQFGR